MRKLSAYAEVAADTLKVPLLKVVSRSPLIQQFLMIVASFPGETIPPGWWTSYKLPRMVLELLSLKIWTPSSAWIEEPLHL